MGAKTWMLVYADPEFPPSHIRAATDLDREKSFALAKRLFPKETLRVSGQGDLSSTCPDDNQIMVGSFPNVAVVAASEFGIDYPSRLPKHFLENAPYRDIYLHAMHSAVDWLAFAHWSDGKLVRALSLSPDCGVLEDIGPRLDFEAPYWAGQRPALDSSEDPGRYPFPFHPLELGEAALAAFFGYRLEGYVGESLLEPENIPLLQLQRSKPRWGFWK